ncbi:hypothetical protein CFP65_3378 [Kitasatospora sp. MMS16-BH015]|uniref:hypothetical protein n=1 Tax=Kitasatospora sp. MMS16-BH015 TaxID=2018025 RepID=UPI000CA0C364|nr:hypothetical protein [Kitasatospora sp. MMS16-BH015]AUG78174.1 hypothetical protein CFP65_3378 [Kitasatospora sp. MMS16-BH015]
MNPVSTPRPTPAAQARPSAGFAPVPGAPIHRPTGVAAANTFRLIPNTRPDRGNCR